MSDAINRAALESEINDLRHNVGVAHAEITAGKLVDMTAINARVETLTLKLQANVFSFEESDRIGIIASLNNLVADFSALEKAITAPEHTSGQENKT